MNQAQKITLLVDGGEAFSRILECIAQARSTIYVNMFVWRDDRIGGQIAQALLEAAERGVRVHISVDRVAMILEMGEEYRNSFFHAHPDPVEWLKIFTIRLLYPRNCAAKAHPGENPGLLQRLLAHPNITVDKARRKADHSKYYIFDDSALILGGINIEEKERSGDCSGRIYQDYMVLLEGRDYVEAFLQKRDTGLDADCGCRFRMNNKTLEPARFEMQESFLRIIDGARKELVIVMSYFAYLRPIADAIQRACRRGVQVRILVPETPNFQSNSNRRNLCRLLKRCPQGLQVRLSPHMVHTKLIANEHTVMTGSCNITHLAFYQLGELDLEAPVENSGWMEKLQKNLEQTFAQARPITDPAQLPHLRAFAWMESRFT